MLKEHNHFKALTLLGIIKLNEFYDQNVKKEGLTLLQKALENDEITPKFKLLVYENMADYYDEIKNFSNCLKFKELAFQLKPSHISLGCFLIRNYIKIKKFGKAINICKKLFKLFPQKYDLAIKLGSLYAYLKNFKKAIKYLNFVKNNDEHQIKAILLLT